MNTGQHRRYAGGFATLPALLGLGLLSGSLGLANPTLERYELASTLQSLSADVDYARGAAITRRTQVVLCPRAENGRCRPNGRWEAGWVIFVDRNGDQRPDATDKPLREVVYARHALTIRSTLGQPVLSYGRDGHNIDRNQLLQVCRGDELLGEMRIDATGRVQTTRPKHPPRCPPP
ncbi:MULTISPECIES: GspH/FimT family pseudopilin [unclassified Lysobacter]|uniref:GspH/FimT family protein n=1 Tax=unclassified Lysobacter TaxID=2635362 RepID=UPI0006FB1627|nr:MULTISPECIES: GspH/FimT family pseudopilin [unclassified Lysobacter]KQZ59987.1 hypothetical protein ASD53_02130 [Lysobacter sp. Root559]KRA77137.1 hypothetical protein ASD78_05930 [Lysobacter sp. Root667]KRC38435.1 hypothetical protein ASE10_02475 [Lysobacter sp. Root76]KRD71368.1 hypothetical protein ASE45_06005 [Lysobacter sp. Root96]